MQDPDLRQLRERREWLDATENIKGAVSKASLVELRSEAKAPFRLIRMFLTLGAGAAAVVSLGITLYALKGVLQGQPVQRLCRNLLHVQSALAVFSTCIPNSLYSNCQLANSACICCLYHGLTCHRVWPFDHSQTSP